MSKDLSAKYYRNNKERLQKRYQSPSKEEKETKQKYGCEWYKNPPEDEKRKLNEYRNRYYKMRKNTW